MILELLCRLEQTPTTVFTESELTAADAEAFARLQDRGMVFALSPASPTVVKDGRLLSVETLDDGRRWAWDDADPEYGPVAVSEPEVALWQVDVTTVAELLAMNLGIQPQISELAPNVLFLGDAPGDVAVVLMWLSDYDSAEPLLRALPTLLPPGYAGFVAVCPAYVPRKRFEKELQGLRVVTARITSDELQIQPSMARLLARLAGKTSSGDGIFESADGRLQYRADFSWLRFDGEGHHPGTYQALVLEALHAAGGPAHEAAILADLDSTVKSERLYDLFRRSPLWRTLVLPEGKGIHRLASY